MTVVSPYPQNLMDGAHPHSVLSKLNEQRSQGLFCDITIVVEDVKFRAHRNILAACSGYFRNALTTPEALTSSQVLELLDLKSEVFASILNFIYCSKVISPCAEDKGGLLAAGKRLGIPFLERLAEQERQEGGVKSKDPSTAPLSKITKKETPRPEEIDTAKGPRITNAFSITEVCHGNNLFTPLIQTNGERQSPDVGQLPSSCSTTSSLSGSNESSQALSEHSYAVVQPTAGHDNSHSDNKRVCKPGMSQPKKLLYRNIGPLKKRHRLTGSAGTALRPEPAEPDTDKLNAIIPTSPDNVSAAPSALWTPPTLSSEDKIERIMDLGRPIATDDVLMGLDPPMLSPHTQDSVAIHGCERCPELFTNKALLSSHSEVHKVRFVSHLFCKFCHRKFIHLKRLRNHEQICPKAERHPSKSDATDMSTKRIHLHLDDMPNVEKSMTQLPSADLSTSYTPEPLQVEQPEPAQNQKTVRPAVSQRRYSCSVCKRVYVTLSSLKRHENVHSWQRAYPCHYCNKVFALAEYRTKHEIWHTGERRYQCIFCLKAFMTYYILKNHQKSSHGIDPSLAVQKKAANSGLNTNFYPIKLYRLLPMKFRKRQYKTYSQTYSENLVGADQASQDSCSLIPPCQQNGLVSQSENVSFQRTFMATTKTVASVMPHISFDHPCDQDVDQSLNIEVNNQRGRRKDSEGRESSFMNNTGPGSPAATHRDDPPLQSNAERRSHDASFLNPLNTFKKLGELSASAKRVEEMTNEILQSSTENLLQDKIKGAKTETYIAKPACPGPSVGGAATPLCQITVKIGNEAIIRRQIKGSKLFPRRKRRIREVSGEGTEGQYPPTRENSVSPRLRFRPEGTTITEPEPCGDPNECDTADLLWRPYYSYKAKKKRKRFKHRKATFQHSPETSADRTTRTIEGHWLTDDGVPRSCGEVKRSLSRNSSPRVAYICEICDSSFITETGLRAHVIGSHPFFCRTCGKQGPPGDAPGGGDYICSNCMENGSCFDKTPRSPNPEKKYRCSFCPQRFLYLATKKSHEKKHQETRKEGYDLMPGSKSSAHLNEHQNQHQNQNAIRTEDRSNPGGPTIKSERSEEGHFSIDRIQPQSEDMMLYSNIKTPVSPGTDPFQSSTGIDPFPSSPSTDPFLSLTPLKGKYKMLKKRHKVQHSMHLL